MLAWDALPTVTANEHGSAAATLFTLASFILVGCASIRQPDDKPLVGVAFLIHGGFDEFSDAALWDSTLQIFSYDPNSFVYKNVIWEPQAWPMILRVGNAPKERGKYSFENGRIGGTDPAMSISRQQLADLRAALAAREDELGVRFIVDYMNWIGDIDHLPQPRRIYNPGVAGGSPVRYCGESASSPDGWPGCDPESL